MKVTIDIDCTPEEARTFLGLPDVGPIQEAMMNKLQEKMEENVRAMDPEQLAKVWMPATMQGLQGWSELQRLFWSQMGERAMQTPSSRPSARPSPETETPGTRSRPRTRR